MKLRYLVPCLTLALLSIAARAQVGLYVNPVGIRVSNSTADTGPFAFLGENSTSRTFYGANIGGYYNFFHTPKTDVGIDVRDSITKGNNASINEFLVGVRIVAKPRQYNFRPYLQISGGAGSTKPPHSTVHITRATFEVYGGLDYPIAKHVDFRVVEVGYGSLSTVSSASFNSGTAVGSSRLLSISTGLVFRIP
ncbi:MAG: hypothetical protein M3Y50_15445 [Acidobacteriota bacterium]|nr:hypothetical protein [Acidobacteriota bacterium]